MEFRELAAGRRVLRPEVDPDELITEPAGFAGAFDLDFVLVDGGDQAGLSGDGSATNSIVRRVDLSEARLGPLTLADVLLDGVDLSNASVQRATIRRSEWRRCRAIGLRLSIEHVTDLYVEDCRLDFATIHIEKAKGVTAFRGCSFRETTISGCVSDMAFLDCDFEGAEFRVANAKGSDFRDSHLTGARGLLTLRGGLITREQAISIADRLAIEAGLVIREQEL